VEAAAAKAEAGAAATAQVVDDWDDADDKLFEAALATEPSAVTRRPPLSSASAATRAEASLSLAAAFLAFSLRHLASQSARSSKRESSQVVAWVDWVEERFFAVPIVAATADESLRPPWLPFAPQGPPRAPVPPPIPASVSKAEVRSGLGGGDAQEEEPDDEKGEEMPLMFRRFVERRRRCCARRVGDEGASIALAILLLARSSSCWQEMGRVVVVILCVLPLRIESRENWEERIEKRELRERERKKKRRLSRSPSSRPFFERIPLFETGKSEQETLPVSCKLSVTENARA
jgi:hypothetical protein